MALNINVPKHNLLRPRISVFGIGGAGGNALNNMIKSNLEGVEFIAANTDAQALSNSLASNRIQLGVDLTKGLGAGSFPEQGKAAAEENEEDIVKYLDGNNMVFIAAGMGGGTGTGAAPVIARLAKERGILTVGVVTKPFHFEGKYRMETAISGIEELRKTVDTLIVIPNQNLFRIANEQTTFESAFKMADDVLHAGVRSVTDLITMPGLINLDFADIKTIMTKMGRAMMGTGEATGENRAINACHEAISNPLLDDISISGAKGVLVNMTGGPDMTLFEADMAVNAIKKEVDPSANIIFGSAFNENMKGKIRISVVATGIDFDAPIKLPEAANSKTFAAIEIKTEARTSEKKVLDAVSGHGQRVFFDPGVLKDPELEITKTNEDFEPRSALEEFSRPEKPRVVPKEIIVVEEEVDVVIEKEPEETKISKKVTVKKAKKDDEEEFDFSKESEEGEGFEVNFSDDLFDDEEDKFKKAAHKISKHQKEQKIEEKPKKSGFGLFGFMNRGKEDAKEVKEVKEIKADKYHQEKPVKLVKPVKVRKEKIEFSITDDEDDIDDLKILTDKKSSAKAPKLSKAPEPDDFSVEDDILNVPAFFRRKK